MAVGGGVASLGADGIIVATGSMPDGKGFQRAMPEHGQLRAP
ncbi:hypothetical protein [Aestuariivirga litoralis]|nr:hypothetical protein [Aestuariivirga litoralis]